MRIIEVAVMQAYRVEIPEGEDISFDRLKREADALARGMSLETDLVPYPKHDRTIAGEIYWPV